MDVAQQVPHFVRDDVDQSRYVSRQIRRTGTQLLRKDQGLVAGMAIPDIRRLGQPLERTIRGKGRIIAPEVNSGIGLSTGRAFAGEDHAGRREDLPQAVPGLTQDHRLLAGETRGGLERRDIERTHGHRTVIRDIPRAVGVQIDDLSAQMLEVCVHQFQARQRGSPRQVHQESRLGGIISRQDRSGRAEIAIQKQSRLQRFEASSRRLPGAARVPRGCSSEPSPNPHQRPLRAVAPDSFCGVLLHTGRHRR